MRSNNNEHNKYFSVDAGISSETITKAERLVMERYSNMYSNWKEKEKKLPARSGGFASKRNRWI
ncbi:TPA: hypothetical protein ACHV56_001353 [Klebsiella pneumoniae]